MGVIHGGNVLAGGQYFYTDFKAPPMSAKKDGGAAVGTINTANLLWVPNLHPKGRANTPVVPLEIYNITTQTIIFPVQTSIGLNIGMDQTNADGVELCGGVLTRSLMNAVAGTNSMGIRAKVKVEDASGVGKFLVGWRRAEAYQADWNDYLDLVAIGISGTSNPNKIQIEKILNNAATVEVDTTMTWADAAEKSLTCLINADRKAIFQVNDAAPTVTTTFTADASDPLVPFILFTHAADLAGTVELTELEIWID